METTRRTIRVADPIWERARAAAERRGETLSEVLREALVEYADRDDDAAVGGNWQPPGP